MDDTYPQPASGPTIVRGPGVLGNDTVPCGPTAKLRVLTNPEHGTVTLNQNGGFTYTPSGPNSQSDQFQYEVECDGRVRHFSKQLYQWGIGICSLVVFNCQRQLVVTLWRV